jgi:hypothetical protein
LCSVTNPYFVPRLYTEAWKRDPRYRGRRSARSTPPRFSWTTNTKSTRPAWRESKSLVSRPKQQAACTLHAKGESNPLFGENDFFATQELHKCAKSGPHAPPLSSAPALPRPHTRSRVPWSAHGPGQPHESPLSRDFCVLHALPRHITNHQANTCEPGRARTSARDAAAGAPRDAYIWPTRAPASCPHRLSCPPLSSAVRFTRALPPASRFWLLLHEQLRDEQLGHHHGRASRRREQVRAARHPAGTRSSGGARPAKFPPSVAALRPAALPNSPRSILIPTPASAEGPSHISRYPSCRGNQKPLRGNQKRIKSLRREQKPEKADGDRRPP